MNPDDYLYPALKEIQRRDPDGGIVQPTDADYDAHQAWAVAKYGQDIWDIYSSSHWCE